MDMWESLVSILVMGFAFLYMINKAHFAQTRHVALVPLGFCAVDLLCAGAVPFGTYPVVSLLLMVLRLAVLLCCAGAMHKDTVAARRAARNAQKKAAVQRARQAVACAPEGSNTKPLPAIGGRVVELEAVRRTRCA